MKDSAEDMSDHSNQQEMQSNGEVWGEAFRS